ncbi:MULTISPECIES: type II toxin-antitoxin system ParD family antitoxin [unclassified Microcystis]|jgi:antitoxin ParD1/3/4|uniref:ribbon-helix-helix domain-containing protein n=2 Tax=Microcystis TaxID=1125 RepID=UPI0022C9E59C|nr:transcriptional regulator [Microcystis sp. LE19-195.1E]MCZ8247974.1 transcriptional regulator [Microcystis sp. LE19-195.1E]
MNVHLTRQQEHLIQRKVKTGKYQSPQEVIDFALQLLDEYEQTDAEWREDIRQKIDKAIFASENHPLIDGETFVTEIIHRFQTMGN